MRKSAITYVATYLIGSCTQPKLTYEKLAIVTIQYCPSYTCPTLCHSQYSYVQMRRLRQGETRREILRSIYVALEMSNFLRKLTVVLDILKEVLNEIKFLKKEKKGKSNPITCPYRSENSVAHTPSLQHTERKVRWKITNGIHN